MKRVIIRLPDSLYAELAEVASSAEDQGYSPEMWAQDLVASELASRRLSKVAPAAYGARIGAKTAEELEPYHLVLPVVEA